MEQSRLDDLLNSCADHLGRKKFYTAGQTICSSWWIEEGTTAAQAAGKIHGDFETNFICAEISKVDDWIEHGGTEDNVRKAGKWVRYGKDYVMQPEDVMIVKHSSK